MMSTTACNRSMLLACAPVCAADGQLASSAKTGAQARSIGMLHAHLDVGAFVGRNTVSRALQNDTFGCMFYSVCWVSFRLHAVCVVVVLFS